MKKQDIEKIKHDFDSLVHGSMTQSDVCYALGIEDKWTNEVKPFPPRVAVEIFYTYLMSKL